MNTPANRLARVSLAAKEMARPRMPADAIHAVTLMFQASSTKYRARATTKIVHRLLNNGRVRSYSFPSEGGSIRVELFEKTGY